MGAFEQFLQRSTGIPRRYIALALASISLTLFLFFRVLSAQQSVSPFLYQPFAGSFPVTAYFDHRYPSQTGDTYSNVVIWTGDESTNGNPYYYNGHEGWDYALPHWTGVIAAASGNAWTQWYDPTDTRAGYGYYARVNHDAGGSGIRTVYGHLEPAYQLEPGVYLNRGQFLGWSGNSGRVEGTGGGYHLHFGVCWLPANNNCFGRVVDPKGWYGQGADPLAHYNGLVSQWLWADDSPICPANSVGSSSHITTLDSCFEPTPTPQPPPPASGWNQIFFSDNNLSAQCGTRIEDDVYMFRDSDGGWGPPGGCPAAETAWSVRMERSDAYFEGGMYEFGLFYDDAARLYIDGELKVDGWNATQHYESHYLSPGTHQLRLEYKNNAGHATVQLWWRGPGALPPNNQTKDPNQWWVNYWGNQTQWQDAVGSQNEGAGFLDRNWGSGGPGFGIPADHFSMRFERTMYFSCGTYRFHLMSDDGSRLWIDGNIIPEFDHWSTSTWDTTSDIVLSEGPHIIKVDHFENGGGARVYLDWQLIESCPPPTMSLSYVTPDPMRPWRVAASVSWNNASNEWHILDWGDGTNVGFFGASGSEVRTHDYPEGSYEMTFRVNGQGGTIYQQQDDVTVVIGCGDDVALPGVVLFDAQDCVGPYEQLSGTGLRNLSSLNNKVTSIHIPDEMSVRLFKDADGNGESFCTSWDMWNMGIDHWPSGEVMNDSISSVRLYDNTICADADVVPELRLERSVPDSMMPWRVIAEMSWSDALEDWHILDWGDGTSTGVFGASGTVTRTHDYSEGSYLLAFTVTGQDLNQYTDSKPVSVVLGCGSDVTLQGVILFDGKDCVGPYAQLFDAGSYELSNFDNRATSIHIPPDSSVRLFEGPSFSGQSLCRTEDMWNMEIDHWPDGSLVDNSISSVVIFPNPDCTYPNMSATLSTPYASDPSIVEANISWSSAGDTWHSLDWGDGYWEGVYGPTGSQTLRHNFEAGNYTAFFTITDTEGHVYSHPMSISISEPGHKVFLPLTFR